MRRKDGEVAVRLELKEGEKYSIKEIVGSLKKKIKSGDLSVICGDCPWLKMGYCEEGLRRIDKFLEEDK